MRRNSLLFGIIGTFTVAFAAVNVKGLQTNLHFSKKIDDISIKEANISIPKKKDLLGTYRVKNDKSVTLSLNDNGTYNLTINVCHNYILLTGTYELRNTKLVLNNNSSYHDDLLGNEELSFTIIDNNQIRLEESLVCTSEKTLFEK